MGILAAALPGVREFRTPFIAGALWSAVLFCLARILVSDDYLAWGLVSVVGEIVEMLPPAGQIGAAAFAVYMLGLLVTAVPSIVMKLRHRHAESMNRIQRITLRRYRGRLVGSGRGQGYLDSAIGEQLANCPAEVRDLGFDLVASEYDIMDVSLASRSVEQFQEYDRVRSEAEFRGATWLPVGILSVEAMVLAPELPTFILAALGVMVSCALGYQSIQKRDDAEERLASAFYFGLATTPLLDSLVGDINRRKESEEHKLLDADYQACAIDFLAARRLLDSAHFLLLRLARSGALREAIDRVRVETWRELTIRPSFAGMLAAQYSSLAQRTVEVTAIPSDVSAEIAESVKRLRKEIDLALEVGAVSSGQLEAEGIEAALGKRAIDELRGDIPSESWKDAIDMLDAWRATLQA